MTDIPLKAAAFSSHSDSAGHEGLFFCYSPDRFKPGKHTWHAEHVRRDLQVTAEDFRTRAEWY